MTDEPQDDDAELEPESDASTELDSQSSRLKVFGMTDIAPQSAEARASRNALGAQWFATAVGRGIISDSFTKGVAETVRSAVKVGALLSPIFAQIQSSLVVGMQPLLEGFKEALPPNWLHADWPDWDEVLELVIDEGLPLAWVPRTDTLDTVFQADSKAARRRVFGSRWRSISQDCLTALDQIDDDSPWASDRNFARLSAEGLLDGHHQLSQAMSISLFDSILRKRYAEKELSRLVNQNNRPELTEVGIKLALVLGGVWAIHGKYWPNRNSSVPTKLSRHASVHAVSRRQYSRVNSVLALCHVTSLICFLDSERD